MNENQNYQNQMMPEAAPGSTAALVLGIISIVTCWLYGVVAIVCGIIAIVQGNKAVAAFNANPSLFTRSSLNNAKAGKICGIVGLSLGALYLLLLAIGIATFTTNGGWERFR